MSPEERRSTANRVSLDGSTATYPPPSFWITASGRASPAAKPTKGGPSRFHQLPVRWIRRVRMPELRVRTWSRSIGSSLTVRFRDVGCWRRSRAPTAAATKPAAISSGPPADPSSDVSSVAPESTPLKRRRAPDNEARRASRALRRRSPRTTSASAELRSPILRTVVPYPASAGQSRRVRRTVGVWNAETPDSARVSIQVCSVIGRSGAPGGIARSALPRKWTGAEEETQMMSR